MANHVHTHVNFHRISDAGKEVLKELYSRVRKGETYEWFSDMFVDGEEGSPTYEEAGQYTFTHEYVGPKWCYFEEFGEDYFTMESAWSWPETGVEWVFEQVGKVDPDFVAYVTYEDECPNFAGVYVYNNDGVYDGFEDDYEEIRQYMMENVEGLAEEWNEEDEEFSDEGQDLYSEMIWETISDYQMDFVHSTLQDLE